MVESRQQRRARERAEAKSARRTAGVAGLHEQDLVQGWPLSEDTTIRLAAPDDIEKVAELVQLAGVSLEDALVDALRTDEGIAAALRTGLRSGHQALLADVATASTQVANDPRRLYLRSALPLVADRRGEIVGTLVSYPPTNVVHRYYTHAAAYGPREQQKVFLLGAVGLAKIKAVAVADTARGAGLGSALLRRCVQVYRACRFTLVYGQIPADRDLKAFYTKLGFEVADTEDPLDLWPIFGYPGGIFADQGERLFARWL
ncbi:GNAT family N-acetyltransferase [Saccharopolyspora pogona]|uniref:GNAT family N-acetyltransferase n=1 Tax=Saccharopolyspora pogona TaxID=333966 RepID=UPI00168381C4|nr:GNAT family N-acetyltransferase [Saccharopolyspora pogona]